jgi:cytochrome d ubiquinol oxidase subunit I
MKMAAADAHWNTSDKPDWAIVAIPDKTQGKNAFDIKIPGLLSFLSYNRFGQQVDGINDLQTEMSATHGAGDYIPNVWITFYAFRFMLLAGLLMILLSLLAVLWRQQKELEKRQKFLNLLIPAIFLPYIANTGGWLVAEVGRQPWIVYGLQTVGEGVSKVVAAPIILLSLLGFTAIYAVLAVIAVKLIIKTCREGMDAGIANLKPAAAAKGGRK